MFGVMLLNIPKDCSDFLRATFKLILRFGEFVLRLGFQRGDLVCDSRARAEEVFDVFAILLIIGLRDWRAAASPRMSRTRHFCTVRSPSPLFSGSLMTRRSMRSAHRSSAARFSGA